LGDIVCRGWAFARPAIPDALATLKDGLYKLLEGHPKTCLPDYRRQAQAGLAIATRRIAGSMRGIIAESTKLLGDSASAETANGRQEGAGKEKSFRPYC